MRPGVGCDLDNSLWRKQSHQPDEPGRTRSYYDHNRPERADQRWQEAEHYCSADGRESTTDTHDPQVMWLHTFVASYLAVIVSQRTDQKRFSLPTGGHTY